MHTENLSDLAAHATVLAQGNVYSFSVHSSIWSTKTACREGSGVLHTLWSLCDTMSTMPVFRRAVLVGHTVGTINGVAAILAVVGCYRATDMDGWGAHTTCN